MLTQNSSLAKKSFYFWFSMLFCSVKTEFPFSGPPRIESTEMQKSFSSRRRYRRRNKVNIRV